MDIGISCGACDYCDFKVRTSEDNKIYDNNIHDTFVVSFIQ